MYSIEPTTPEQRNDPRVYQMFFLWFAANLDIQKFVLGHLTTRKAALTNETTSFACSSVAPVVFGLGIRTSSIIVVVVDTLCVQLSTYVALFEQASQGMHTSSIFVRSSFVSFDSKLTARKRRFWYETRHAGNGSD